MNKIYLGVVLAVIVVVGIFTLNNINTVEYVATIDSEVTQLENELAELDLMVADGSITEEQATDAKIKILTRLNTINESVASSEKAKLTPAQQKQLSEGLDRLKTILINYRATLAVIDDKAVETNVDAKIKNRKGGSNKTIIAEMAETIDTVRGTTEDAVEDYETDANLDEQIDEAVSEEESGELTNDQEETPNNDETVDESEETMDNSETDNSGDTVDEEETSMETPTMDDSTTIEIEAEGEVEVTQ
ncbi:hypothetical protein H6781_00660 [Candidatus Nomurabacteria bacterium]|nr:hypothetical protein [Candidatus Nomurabacteria bacterium]